MELASCAIVFALVLGIPAGMLAAVRRNSVFDHGVVGISLTGYSTPIFWWGLLLILDAMRKDPKVTVLASSRA